MKNNNLRIGETRLNNLGSKMWIVKYNNSLDVKVEFENGHIVKSTYQQFKNGSVKNPLDCSVFGVGKIGVGRYTSSNNKTAYSIWNGMLNRVYGSKYINYKDCSMVDEWHNFQNFAKWYEDNYYKIKGQRMEIDKDILLKGNKIYSPDTCVFVPQEINLLFTKSNSKRSDTPIGVSQIGKDKYIARCNRGKKIKQYLGTYTDPVKAFKAYKKYKEYYIKTVAEKYKGEIPDKLYNALINYTVEITD